MLADRDARPVVRLADDRLERGPWVYGRRVERPDVAPEDGALVEVLDASDRFVGHALWNGRSDVRLRWLSRGRRKDLDRPAAFLADRLRRADGLRRKTLRLERVTDAYRVVHGEGDDLPGLAVDRLGDVLVIEYHALGFLRLRDAVWAGLEALYPDLRRVERVPPSALRAEGFEPDALGLLEGGADGRETWVTEHGLRFPVRPGTGHKTGFFCDQRDNRQRVAALCEGRTLLDLCCNTAGFSLHAKARGAGRVDAVDLDEVVLERAARAAEANGLEVTFRHADAFDVLREAKAGGRTWDMVVLDPSKLASGRAKVEAALRKYADWNALALQAVRPGGLLATFSCSGAVDLPTFLGTVFHAARRAGCGIRLLEVWGEAADHPQRPEFPRSRYLKGVLLAVDR